MHQIHVEVPLSARLGRLAVFVVLAGVGLTACGSESDSGSNSASGQAPEAVTTAESSTTSLVGADTTAEPEEPACREIEHAAGVSCVPVDPQRIVALDPLTVLPTLLALDAPVVATVSTYEFGEPFVDYLDPASYEGLDLVGSFSLEPNFELIAAAEPDLIIASASRVGEHYDTLSQIAPVVATGYAYYEPDWRKEILLTADAVGRVEAAEAQLAELDAHIARTRELLASAGVQRTLSRVDVWRGQPLYYQFACVWFGGLLEEVGVAQPEAQVGECTPGDAASTVVYLSLENMDVLEADAIVAYQQQASAEDQGADPTVALLESPLWATLGPVQADRVFVLGDAWGLGGSVQAAHRVLDDLVEIVFAGA